jgi:hypothetical protein
MAGMTVFDRFVSIAARGWDWSREWHCLGDVSDTFAGLFGIDPMGPVRGRYTAEIAAARAVRRAGGLDAFSASLFAAAGLVRANPQIGAIGIGPTGVPSFGGRAALICLEPGLWAGKSAKGATMIEMDDVEAWTCPR